MVKPLNILDIMKTRVVLVKRPVLLDLGKIATSMVWHVRSNNDKKHLWLREQI